MKPLLQLEEFGMFLFSIFLFMFLPFSWWVFPVLILTPDISMVGYIINGRVGAICYNFAHHKAVALALIVCGYFLQNNYLMLAGIILFGHSSMDRMFGYGMKYMVGFKFTHLGKTGKE